MEKLWETKAKLLAQEYSQHEVFYKTMHRKFEMTTMRELKIFHGIQISQCLIEYIYIKLSIQGNYLSTNLKNSFLI